MERYTFEEIKNLKFGDIFWTANQKYSVSSEMVYKNVSNFYGEPIISLEWFGTTGNPIIETKFQVSNITDTDVNTLIFKDPETLTPPVGE